ncbi:MAG: pirin family protein [Leptospiraceae bacterium]|nr:pirin family protein [Leptospiraceae bacterium]
MEATSDPVDLVIESRKSDIGGFSVRRTLPFAKRRTVGPFIFFDHMGPALMPAGQSMDVLPHPHIGLATVTYLFEGEIVHRDSLGSQQAIRPGAINWMVAGKGIVHSERTDPEIKKTGQTIHGIQLWVALPKELEDCDPAFLHYDASEIPESSVPLNTPGEGTIRLMIGNALGMQSPVQTFLKTLYAEVRLPGGSAWTLPSLAEEQAMYLASGTAKLVGSASAGTLQEGQMAVLKSGASLDIQAESDLRMLIIGGENPGPRKIYWNFVHSNPAKIEEAKIRWENQKFPSVPGETEFVPLPQ